MISWPIAALTAALAALLAFSHVVTTIVLVACVVLALMGPARAMQALAVATLVNYANPAIVKLGAGDGILLRIILITAVVRVLPTFRASDVRVLWPVMLFGLVSALTSLAVSPAIAVSLMKVITFTLAANVVLVAFGGIPPAQLRKLQSWFLTVGITIIALSALTLAKPAIGLGLNGGLQGLFGQPQALGIFIAPFAAWTVTGVLMMRRQRGWLELWIALGTVVLLFLTRARTGAVALMLAVGIVLLSRLLTRRSAPQAKLSRPIFILAIVTATVFGVALATGRVSSLVKEFAYKGTEEQNRDLGEAFYASRGGGVLSQWENFRSSPFLGHGFGVYADGSFPSGITEWLGIPISAPIEKGFLPTAALEEGGVLGGATLTLLIVWLSRLAWRNTDLRWRAMYVACLGMNIGECVFLAPGGIGMLDWLFLAMAVFAYRAAPFKLEVRRNKHPQQHHTVPQLDATGSSQLSTSGA